jgi:hypothetical protein
MPHGIVPASTSSMFSPDFTLKTAATFTDNSGSQFDLVPNLQIYAALGFTFNQHTQLPVQRDARPSPA